jgi:hypothetical protein
MKKVYSSILFTLIFFPQLLSGQAVMKQAGLRTGYRGGFFYQVTSDAGNAELGYNALLSFSNNGVQITALKVVYETSLSEISPELYFAWGYGGHTGFVYTDHLGFLGERFSFKGERFCPIIGADGWLSAEYRFRDIPLNISLNVKPFVELTIPAFVKIMPADFGLSVSYAF